MQAILLVIETRTLSTSRDDEQKNPLCSLTRSGVTLSLLSDTDKRKIDALSYNESFAHTDENQSQYGS